MIYGEHQISPQLHDSSPANGLILRRNGIICRPENGIIFGAAMAEKTLENYGVRYSAAYPTGAERFFVSLEVEV